MAPKTPMTRWLGFVGACALVLGALMWPPMASFGAEPVATVQNLRVSHDNDRTRLVLDLDRDVSYRWFTLPTPPRLVLDFPNIAVQPDLARMDLPKGSLVTSMRAGTFRPGTVRMVLDLDRQARISIFTIPSNTQRGPRLVMDIMPPSKGKPATNVPPPPDVVTQDAFDPYAARGQPRATPADAQPDSQPAAPVVPRQVVVDKSGPVVVVLDPGHGGIDPGACGRRLKLCEKGLTLEMAQMVRNHLQQKGGYKVLLTREKDVFVPLAERVRFAQRNNAGLFVSFHADAHPKPEVRGATVYMVSEKASDAEAQRLANSENAGDILAGVDISHESKEIQNILMSLAQRNTLNHSSYLAQSMITEMDRVLTLRKNTPLFAGFRVLKAPDIPSILVEMGYLSNAHEEARLNDPKHRRALAKAMAEGIDRYVQTNLR